MFYQNLGFPGPVNRCFHQSVVGVVLDFLVDGVDVIEIGSRVVHPTVSEIPIVLT